MAMTLRRSGEATEPFRRLAEGAEKPDWADDQYADLLDRLSQ